MITLFTPLLIAGQFLIVWLFAGQWQTIRYASLLFAFALALVMFFFDPSQRKTSAPLSRKLYLIVAGIAVLIGLFFQWKYGKTPDQLAHLKNGGFLAGAPFAMWGIAAAAVVRAIVAVAGPKPQS